MSVQVELSPAARHLVWLSDMAAADCLSRNAAAAGALVFWAAEAAGLPVPAAAVGPDGGLAYSWDAGPHHLEAEINDGRPTEWFYRNRDTGEFWGDNAPAVNRLPAEVADQYAPLVAEGAAQCP